MSKMYVLYNKLKFILQEDLSSGVAESTNVKVRFVDSDTGGARTVASGAIIIGTLDPDNTTRKGSEFVLMTVGTTTSGVTNITSMVRGLSKDGTESVVGDSDKAEQWESGTEGGVTTSMYNMNIVKKVLDGDLSSGLFHLVGDGTHDNEQGYKIDGGGANPVIFGMDTSGNPIIQLEDGSSYIPGAGAGSISGGDGIDVTSSVISVDLGTDKGLEIDTAKLAVKLKTDGGIDVDSDGLSVDESDLSLSELGEKSILSLSDTPSSFTDQANKILRVNAGATALEFVTFPSEEVVAPIVELRGVDIFSITENEQQVTSSPDGEYVYVLRRTTSTKHVYRYERDSLTGLYYYSGVTIELANATYGWDEADGGIAVGETYVWVAGSATGFKLVRLSLALASPQVMTISGIGTAGVIRYCAGDDNKLVVGQASTSTTYHVYTISGTTATRGTNFTFTASEINRGFYCDGTYFFLYDQTTGLYRIAYDLASNTAIGLRAYHTSNKYYAGIGQRGDGSIYLFSPETMDTKVLMKGFGLSKL